MTMNLNDAGNGLFDIQGKVFGSITTLNAAGGTEATTAIAAASSFCQSLLIAWVAEDSNMIDTNLTGALTYLITQMETNGDYVTPNVVAGTLTTDGSNVGDTIVCWSLIGGDGTTQQLAYGETITLTVADNPNANTPSIKVLGEAKIAALDPNWKQGSGVNRTISATNPTASLLPNGDFEDSTYANIPTGWIVAVGVPGTTVMLTAPEQQTVAIAGTPTGGSYILLYTDRNGDVRSTPAIAYNATSGTVQTALRTIADLAGATVTATGTTPDFTHTIVFTGTGGNIAQLTSINLMTGGSPAITHATTIGGDTGDYRGVALKLVGNSSVLHTLYAPLTTLKADTVYFAHLRALRSGTSTGAVIKVAIVQEIGGMTLDDDAGNANELEIDAAVLSDSTHESKWFSFRLPTDVVSPVYLRVAATTAIPTGGVIYLDEVAVAAGTEIYNGGPFLSAFSGRTPAVAGDTWTLAVTNSHDSSWNDFYNRSMDLAGKGLLLPTTGSSLISDNDVYPA